MRTSRASKRLLSILLLCLSIGAAESAYADDATSNGIPSQAALKTKMALKLAGLVTFVAASCPKLKADYSRFKSAESALGLSYEDLAKTEMKATYLRYALLYKESKEENCIRAKDQFGPGGKVVPNIFGVVDAPSNEGGSTKK